MANRRFIDFPIASTVGDSDIILIWQSGANKQTTKATFLSGLPENLDELNDVAISGLTNGQILRYDSVTGKWENTDQGNLDLNDLNDVSIVSPSNGQVLVYNSSTSKWENSSGGYVPYTGAVTTVNLGAQTIQAGQFVKAGGTAAQFLKADGSVDSNTYGTGTVTSVALTMPSAFNVANSPITTAGTLAVTGAGTVGQYIRGDGSLADFPQASGGGSSVNYYLNGSISQGTIGGVAYKELNKVPILGSGTQFSINADGYIASFLTDAGDPNLLEIPGGNWNFETYFSASSSGGTPTFYVELYKYDGTTFTLIASSSTSPELIAFGTNLNPYFSTLAVPTTTLALTDRLAVRFYVTHSGRTITMHTENNTLCQIVTTFTTGLTSLNGLTAQVQNLAVGTSGTDFNIASATATHTFNLPTASATNRGALSSADWTTFNNKQNALTNPVTGIGTTNYLPKFTGASTIGNSVIQESSSNIGIGVGPSFPLDLLTSSAGTFNTIVQFYNNNFTSGNKSFLRVRQQINAGASYSSYFGTGQDGNLYIIANDSARGGDLVINGNTGNVLIGTNTDSGGRLEVAGGGIFSLLLSGNITDATRKFAFIQGKHYTNSKEPISMIGIDSQVSSSILYIGGGLTSGLNSVTGISFYTAANNTTVTGTEQMRIFSDGNVLIQSGGTFTNNGAKLQVSGTATVSGIVTGNANEAFRLDPSSGASYMNFRIGGTSYSLIGIAGTTSDIIAGSALGDLNIRAANSQKILFSTNNGGSAAMTITSSGNVLIGTATDQGQRLLVQGTGGTTGFTRFTDGATAAMFIGVNSGTPFIHSNNSTLSFGATGANTFSPTMTLSSGNVGINTASPLSKFHVNTGTNQNFRVRPGTDVGATNGVALNSRTDDDGSLQQLTLRASDVIMLTSGNVGIGTSSPSALIHLASTTNPYLRIQNTTTTHNGYFGSTTNGIEIGTDSASASINFYTGSVYTERMRITSGGFLKASNTGVYAGSTALFHEFITNQTNNNIAYFWNTSASPYGPYVRFSGAAPNNGTNYYFYCDDTSAARFIVYSNGGISNYQANNTNLSDERTKKEISPLESYWDKFKAIEIVKFKYKDQTHDDFNIGVIAQQVEKVAPEFVDVDGWDNKTEGNEVVSQEEPIKSIYTADLHHATIKVLQEAMAKIEAMQKEINTLKN